MRGRPLLELVAVLLAGLLAGLLLLAVTAPAPAVPPPLPATPGGENLTPAWVLIRLSHPARGIMLKHAGRVVPLDPEGDLRHAGMIDGLLLEGGRALFTLETAWADPAAEGYAEVRIEPDYLPARSIGFWGRQAASTRFELTWPEHE